MKALFKSAKIATVAIAGIALLAALLLYWNSLNSKQQALSSAAPGDEIAYQPRQVIDTSGFGTAINSVGTWKPEASLAVIASYWKDFGYRRVRELDQELSSPRRTTAQKITLQWTKAELLNYEGEPAKAYETLKAVRAGLLNRPEAAQFLYSVIYYQGLTGLRLGETENCVHCRGTSACILPFDRAAVHQFPRGSRLAVQHFTEYLKEFPDDLEVRWLLNLAHMTLGQYPEKVDPRYRISLDKLAQSKFNIGEFQDISYLTGLDHDNQAGGSIMDDFDGDGRLDLVLSCMDPTRALRYFHNTGTGKFVASTPAGFSGQLGGLNCVQADYNNDGYLDILVVRGAWLKDPIRPSLLRNNGNGTFSDVTVQAGLHEPVNSNAGVWADYDNDGYLDLFICCEKQPSRLYHNEHNGTFKEVAGRAGLLTTTEVYCKGAAWIDYDGDDYPDLFTNYLDGASHLFRNNRSGHFTDVTGSAGLRGPIQGFSCWEFDYDNDGRPDLFATSYERTPDSIVQGVLGEAHPGNTSKLYRNVDGTRFEDVTQKCGLDLVFGTMGSNFGDFDNDGFLDMYLATGDPNYGTLIPNRMFKNVDGQRFSDITGSSRTGHLQKGHGVACGDWDRDGNIDLFVEMGGAVPGDEYHNALFQNPGHDSQWLTVKLVGKKSNRAAIGARLKVVTSGPAPRTIYRSITSGSSFGGNPLQQTIGLGKTERVASLEVHWPTSHTTQTFRDLAVNQSLEVTEFAAQPRVLNWPKLPTPMIPKPKTTLTTAAK